MNILFSVWSDLKQRMGACSHALSILLLYGVGLATMPSTSVAQTHDRMAESDVESILKRMDASLSAVSKRMDAAAALARLFDDDAERLTTPASTAANKTDKNDSATKSPVDMLNDLFDIPPKEP